MKRKSLIFISFLIAFLFFNGFIKDVYASLSVMELASATEIEGSPEYGFYGVLGVVFFDVNNDGYEDVIVPARSNGDAYIYFGSENIDLQEDIFFDGPPFSGFYSYPSSIADLDNDGNLDIVFGGVGASDYGTQAGYLSIFNDISSYTGDYIANNGDFIIEGDLDQKYSLGTTIDIADFNGDGFLDIAAGAPRSNTLGNVDIFLGDGTGMYSQDPDYILTMTGSMIAPINGSYSLDLNQDGYDDIMIIEDANPGHIVVFFGGEVIDDTVDVTFIPTKIDDGIHFTDNFASGDIDNDGKLDLCFGVKGDDTVVSNGGNIYCFSDTSTLLGDTPISSADFVLLDTDGVSEGDNLGRSVKLKDINNDGNLDLIVGAYQQDGSNNGYVNIYFGDEEFNYSSIPNLQLTDNNGNFFGISLNTGDIDNDGWQELAVTTAQGGVASYSGILYLYAFDHAQIEIKLENTSTDSISGSVTDNTQSTISIGGVQWNATGIPYDDWYTCQAQDGVFNSVNEEFTCDISSLTSTSATIYIRSYDENSMYSPQRDYKTVNVSQESIDATSPIIRITEIGLINNIPNQDSLFYYFTSQNPHIVGTSEANSTVIFTYDGNEYTTTTNGEGIFDITIPDLPRERLELTYYAQDQAGNKSGIKSLTLVIGVENFPTELVESSDTDEEASTDQAGEQTTNVVPLVYEYEIIDEEGNVLPETKVVIDGQEYLSDIEGKIYIEVSLLDGTQASIYNDEDILTGYVKGERIILGNIDQVTDISPETVEDLTDNDESSFCKWYVCLLILIIISTGGYYSWKKLTKQRDN